MGRVIQLFGTGGFDYEFTVDGGVSQISGGPAPSEGNDVLRNDDGTQTVTGLSGCSNDGSCIMGDSFEIDSGATVESFQVSPQTSGVTTWVTLDGKPSSPSEIESAFQGDEESDDSTGGIGGLPVSKETLVIAGIVILALSQA